MKTSAAPIEDAVNVSVFGFALEAWLGAAADAQEGIAGRIRWRCGGQGFQAGGGFAPVGKHEPLAPGDTAQHALGISC